MSPANDLDPPKLFTIGYQGKSVQHYVDQLSEADVSVICDVR